ncbi:MAG TPA: hypothetical protein VJ476_15530 [Rhizomicrobium sp.]|nr:hypothetical protein [Rhizomicrobium sp.]
MTKLEFPFVRDQYYSIGALRAFELELATYRQRDQEFSGELRSNRLPWAKAWNEELVPIALMANQKCYADRDAFRLMPEGHSTDVEILAENRRVACQVTVADPAWSETGPGSSGSYLHHLRMEQLRQGGPAFGGGNTCKIDGTIISEPHARDALDDLTACRRRLVEAIERKRSHEGKGTTLVIYARGHRFLLIDFDMTELVAGAVRDADAQSFERVCVVDDKFIWETP